ncbi:hypothetical protein TrRE_jg13430, partial [Triparma retinervis]
MEAIKSEISWADEEISLAHARIKQLKTIKNDLKKLSKVAKGGIAVDESAMREITSRAGPGGGKALSKVPSLPHAVNVGTGDMFSDYFITKGTVTPKTTLQTSAKVESFAVLAFKPKGAGPGRSSKRSKRKPNDFTTVANIIAVSTTDSMIHFFESDGTLITSYPATHVVTKFAFDSGDSPLLITGGKDGSVLFHNMTLWKNDHVIVGKRPRAKVVPGEFNKDGTPKRAKPPPPSKKNSNGIALVVHLESIADTPPSCYDGGKLPAVLGLSLYAPRGNGVNARKVVVSDDAGAVRLYFAKNGTMMRSFDLDVPQTSSSMAKTGVTLAIGTGSDVSFVHASKADKVLSRCDGISGTRVVSVAYDVLIPSYLYAGLDNGDVLVFDTKFRANKQASSAKATCKLLYKATSGGETIDGIFGLKGYLLSTASAGNSMSVHNTTSAREERTRYLVDNSANMHGKPYSGYGVAVSEGSGNKIE